MDSELKRIKYPRTFNLPFSQSDSSDDVWFENTSFFEGKEIVMLEKADGECTSIYPDGYVHARSIDTDHHPSRTWIKKFAAQFAHDIPKKMRICGENVFAYHSIFYTELPSYFLTFGIYELDKCLSWDETEELCSLLGLETVPLIYRGIWDEKLIREKWNGKGAYPTYGSSIINPKYPKDFKPCLAEGYVIRLVDSFDISQFQKSVGKYVRKNHVSTSVHWMSEKVVPNLLKTD
ncbi:MAG: RNA ligase family protein [bacterium]